jgi:formate-dependent nitrite reductase membrane component NrfD/ferredoxin
MFQRPDGIVDFNRKTCIGCKACIAACPYDAIYIDPESHSAEKCNFCAHRVDAGLEPACVVVCPTQAIIVGDLNDPQSEVSQLVAAGPTSVRRPEKGTRPKLFYIEADATTIDPLAAFGVGAFPAVARNDLASSGGLPGESSAAAILSYSNRTEAPWDWRVSVYSWTKSIGGGAFVVAALGAFFANVGDGRFGWDMSVVAVSAVFTALTGLLLIGDLSHPGRFYTIFLRPRWGSWLVRGAALISGFTMVLAAAFFTTLAKADDAKDAIGWAGIVLGTGMVVYTAFLFRQAKGRDLWQDPLLPMHTLAKGALAGGAVLAILTLPFTLSTGDVTWIRWVIGIAGAAHFGVVAGFDLMLKPTAHARRAARNLTRGAWARYHWSGAAVTLAGVALTLLTDAAAPGGVAVLLGLLASEHAYVQAGQSVPLT